MDRVGSARSESRGQFVRAAVGGPSPRPSPIGWERESIDALANQNLRLAINAADDSPSPIRWERAGVRVPFYYFVPPSVTISLNAFMKRSMSSSVPTDTRKCSSIGGN